MCLNFCIPFRTFSGYFKSMKVHVDPYPIVVGSGKKVKVSVTIDLVKPIEVGTKVSVEIKKNVFGMNTVVPCTDVSYSS